MSVQRWGLSHHKDRPFSIHITEVPAWAAAVEWAAEAVDRLLRHRLCNPPGVAWRIPLWLRRDEDGFWSHSLGSAIWTGFQWAAGAASRRETASHTIPITRAQATAIDPATVAEWTDLFNLDKDAA